MGFRPDLRLEFLAKLLPVILQEYSGFFKVLPEIFPVFLPKIVLSFLPVVLSGFLPGGMLGRKKSWKKV